jgi:HlyD family secretion protein
MNKLLETRLGGAAALTLAIAVLGTGAWLGYRYMFLNAGSDGLTLYGNVDIRDVNLSFRVPGRISEMRFEEGDRVSASTVLAVLDQDTFQDDKALAEAEVAEAQAVYANAKQSYGRRAELVKTGAVSAALYDSSLAAKDQGEARIETAKAKLSKAETSLGDTELKSPSDGIILTRVREPGSTVQVGQTIYTLALDKPIWVRAYVDEPHLSSLHPGQVAQVVTDGGKTYQGKIGFISPQAEFTPKNVETPELRTDLVYRLRVIIDTPDESLRQGMPVTVKIKTPRA